MSNSIHFRPSFNVYGLQSYSNPYNVNNQAHIQPQFYSNTYLNNNGTPLNPILQPNNLHINRPLNSSVERGRPNIQKPTMIISEAPIMPRDPEMLKNIDLLSSSVVKQGLSIEKMIQEKEANNPKFGFLFESAPGTEASIGKFYYEWKKNALLATFHPQPQPQSQAPTSSNYDCGKFQVPPSSQIQASQKEIFNSIDQDSISSGGVDMEIEDDYEEPIEIYIKESKNVEELKNESDVTISNTLNSMLHHKLDIKAPKEACEIEKVENTSIAKEDIIDSNEENHPHSTNYDVINGIHQILDDNKVEDILEVTPTCCDKIFQQSIFTKKDNALIKIPLEKTFGIEDKQILKSYENNYNIEKEIESNSILKLKQDDALEKNSIKIKDSIDIKKILEIKNLKSRNCSSHSSGKEEHCCLKSEESSEVVVNQPSISKIINAIPRRSQNIMENIESKDFISNVDDEENCHSPKLKLANEIVENQHIESKIIDTELQASMDVVKSSMISKYPISNIIENLSPKENILDEFGRIMKNRSNSNNDEDIHFIDPIKNTSKECFKNDELTIIDQNHEIYNLKFNPSPQSNNKQKESCLQKYEKKKNMLLTKDVDHNNNISKNYGHLHQNVNDGDNVKRRRFGKCIYYARGHCRRGYRCWFEHSKIEIDEKCDVKCDKYLNKNGEIFKQKNWQVVNKENCNGNISSNNGAKKHNKKSDLGTSLEKNIDYYEVQSKTFDDYNYKQSNVYLEYNKFVEKSHESGSLQYNGRNDKQIYQNERRNKQKSSQEDVEENSNSCNGSSNAEGKNLKSSQNNKNKSFEENIDYSQGLSNCRDYKKCEIYSKHDELSIKSPKDIKKSEHKLEKRKLLLTNTTTSSDHPSAISSTASLDHPQGISSLISPAIQTSIRPPVSQLPNITTLPIETSTPLQVPQISDLPTPIQTSIPHFIPQISNLTIPMQNSMQPQIPQISNFTMPIGNKHRKLMSTMPSDNIFGNIPNSTSLNAFIPKQTSIQTNMSHLPLSNPNVVHSTSTFDNTPNIVSFRNFNVPPPIQYPKLYTPISQNFKIQQDNIMQPSHFLSTTSKIHNGNQNSLPSFSNSQHFLQNMKYPPSSLLQSDYIMSLKHPLQPYNYVQTSILNKSPQQQQQYIINPIPQIKNDFQPTFRGPSSKNIMQCVNQRFPTPPPPTFKYNSLLTPTTLRYSTQPIEASMLQQNYVVPPPPPPPPLESFLSTKYDTFGSYPHTQIYSSLQKPNIGSEPFANQSYEATNACPTAITILPSKGQQKPKHETLQPYTVETPSFENVSPAGGQSWTGAKEDETAENVATRTSKHEHKKKCHPKARGLTLLSKSVAGYIKELLKPKWREGIMTKEAFKTITKKTVDKVTGTVKPNHVPNNDEKVATYMNAARPKILKLVQGYVRKYVKD